MLALVVTFCRLSSAQLSSALRLLNADHRFVLLPFFYGLSQCLLLLLLVFLLLLVQKQMEIDKDMRFDEDCAAVFGIFSPPPLPLQFNANIVASDSRFQLLGASACDSPPLIHSFIHSFTHLFIIDLPLKCASSSRPLRHLSPRSIAASCEPQCLGSCMQVAFLRDYIEFAAQRNLCVRLGESLANGCIVY